MTNEEAIQILNLYDLGNTFLDIDGNSISYEKMSSACDMAIEALRKQKTGQKLFTPENVLSIMVENGQRDSRFKLGEIIKYSPTEVMEMLKAADKG